jgi:hypothetical protein
VNFYYSCILVPRWTFILMNVCTIYMVLVNHDWIILDLSYFLFIFLWCKTLWECQSKFYIICFNSIGKGTTINYLSSKGKEITYKSYEEDKCVDFKVWIRLVTKHWFHVLLITISSSFSVIFEQFALLWVC